MWCWQFSFVASVQILPLIQQTHRHGGWIVSTRVRYSVHYEIRSSTHTMHTHTDIGKEVRDTTFHVLTKTRHTSKNTLTTSADGPLLYSASWHTPPSWVTLMIITQIVTYNKYRSINNLTIATRTVSLSHLLQYIALKLG